MEAYGQQIWGQRHLMFGRKGGDKFTGREREEERGRERRYQLNSGEKNEKNQTNQRKTPYPLKENVATYQWLTLSYLQRKLKTFKC